LIVYAGAPHGLTDTHKERLNEDLLAFIREPVSTARAPSAQANEQPSVPPPRRDAPPPATRHH
jgi:hypothetical protein